MKPFIDEINRLFQELVHESWDAPRSWHRSRQLLCGDTLELELPIPGAKFGHIAVATEGGRLTITVGHLGAGVTELGNVRAAEGPFQQSVELPAGTEPAAIEVRADLDALRIRISLRRSSRG